MILLPCSYLFGRAKPAGKVSRIDRRHRVRSGSRGFTLVEMIVAVGLFAIVMIVSMGALLALVAANRKAQAVQSVVNNLNIAIDGMVRTIRMGTVYHCGSSGGLPLSPADCPSGAAVFAFEPYGKTKNDQPWVYSYDSATGRIYRATNGGAPIAITAPEVQITDMEFFVVGADSGPGNEVQPKVVITIKGVVNAQSAKYSSTFHIQATAVQRQLDI